MAKNAVILPNIKQHYIWGDEHLSPLVLQRKKSEIYVLNNEHLQEIHALVLHA